MQKAYSSIVQNYEIGFIFLAILVLIIGASITMRLFARVRRSQKSIRSLWLYLSGLTGGGTIWSVHFLGVLAFAVEVPKTYDIGLIALSLFIAVLCVVTGFALAASRQRSVLIEVGGAVIGIGVFVMHYVGISAMEMEAAIEWDYTLVFASLVLACFFGAIATNRIARPITRFCKYGGTLSFFLAVSTMNILAMAAMTIVPVAVQQVVINAVPETYLGLLILVVMLIVMSTTMVSYWIDQKNSQETTSQFKHLALHDPLTGLANRDRAEEYLHNVVRAELDNTARIAVVAFKLNRFKEVNDVHGHNRGDVVLKNLAKRLSEGLKENEFIARFGGDEFVAIKYPIFMDRQTQSFCDRLKALVEEPVVVEDVELSFSASVGYAYYPEASDEPKQLMHRANLAMHHAKEQGQNRIVAYSEGLDEDTKTRGSLAMDLKNALENDEFELFYQLQNDAKTREVIGAEALLRWNHPEKGRISPNLFIPIAEETGQILEIGDWVLRAACEEATHWAVPYTVAVNVASQQLMDAGFPSKVEKALRDTGLDPERLEIEITETGIIADVSFVLNVVTELKSLGVKIAMDDYGTGYSSLSTLQNFPFDKIKIDREFVRELPDNKQSLAIIQATIILGGSLGMPILAEGVETEEQLEFLAEVGCMGIQGFLFGRPMPAREIRDIAIEERCRNFKGVLDQADGKIIPIRKSA